MKAQEAANVIWATATLADGEPSLLQALPWLAHRVEAATQLSKRLNLWTFWFPLFSFLSHF